MRKLEKRNIENWESLRIREIREFRRGVILMEGKDRIVIVDVTYGFCEERQEFRALLKAYISEEDGLLPEIFRDKSEDFWGSALTSTWGWSSEERDGYRYNHKELYHPDLELLRDQVKDYINDEIEHLREVVHANVLAHAEIPEPEHYEFVI
ncbi:MAG: hypothetical protein ACTSR2_00145 [Candidatus Hodarchaeales archaeon]